MDQLRCNGTLKIYHHTKMTLSLTTHRSLSTTTQEDTQDSRTMHERSKSLLNSNTGLKTWSAESKSEKKRWKCTKELSRSGRFLMTTCMTRNKLNFCKQLFRLRCQKNLRCIKKSTTGRWNFHSRTKMWRRGATSHWLLSQLISTLSCCSSTVNADVLSSSTATSSPSSFKNETNATLI